MDFEDKINQLKLQIFSEKGKEVYVKKFDNLNFQVVKKEKKEFLYWERDEKNELKENYYLVHLGNYDKKTILVNEKTMKEYQRNQSIFQNKEYHLVESFSVKAQLPYYSFLAYEYIKDDYLGKHFILNLIMTDTKKGSINQNKKHLISFLANYKMDDFKDFPLNLSEIEEEMFIFLKSQYKAVCDKENYWTYHGPNALYIPKTFENLQNQLLRIKEGFERYSNDKNKKILYKILNFIVLIFKKQFQNNYFLNLLEKQRNKRLASFIEEKEHHFFGLSINILLKQVRDEYFFSQNEVLSNLINKNIPFDIDNFWNSLGKNYYNKLEKFIKNQGFQNSLKLLGKFPFEKKFYEIVNPEDTQKNNIEKFLEFLETEIRNKINFVEFQKSEFIPFHKKYQEQMEEILNTLLKEDDEKTKS